MTEKTKPNGEPIVYVGEEVEHILSMLAHDNHNIPGYQNALHEDEVALAILHLTEGRIVYGGYERVVRGMNARNLSRLRLEYEGISGNNGARLTDILSVHGLGRIVDLARELVDVHFSNSDKSHVIK